MYRLIEENKLRRLIEGNMIYEELCAQGVDNWIGCDFMASSTTTTTMFPGGF